MNGVISSWWVKKSGFSFVSTCIKHRKSSAESLSAARALWLAGAGRPEEWKRERRIESLLGTRLIRQESTKMSASVKYKKKLTQFDHVVPPELINLSMGAPGDLMLRCCTDVVKKATAHRMV